MITLLGCSPKITKEYSPGKPLYEKTKPLPYFCIFPSKTDSNEYVFWKHADKTELNANVKEVEKKFGTWYVDLDGDTKADKMILYKVGRGGDYTVLQTYYRDSNFRKLSSLNKMIKESFKTADFIIKTGLENMKKDLQTKEENEYMESKSRF